jgi:hypothetical protein
MGGQERLRLHVVDEDSVVSAEHELSGIRSSQPPLAFRTGGIKIIHRPPVAENFQTGFSLYGLQ